MLSSVPRYAPWLYQRDIGGKVVKVFEKSGFRTSLLGFNQNFSRDDNRLYIPMTPMVALDNQLNEVRQGAYSDVKYPVPYTVGENLATLAAYAGTAWLTVNGGKTWSAKSATGKHRVAQLIKFKGDLLYQDTDTAPYQWLKRSNAQNLNGTPTAVKTGDQSVSVGVSDHWAKNANCIVGSSSNVATSTKAFICWSFPNFIGYELDARNSAPWSYLGSNVFLCRNSLKFRFIYVPVTPGAPTVLAEIPTTTALTLAHIHDKLFSVTLNGEVLVAPLEPNIENSAMTLADARTYVQRVLDALDGDATTLLAPGPFTWAIKWGYNRFVFYSGSANNTFVHRIWEVQPQKPTDTFTIKAGTTGTAAMGSIGFSLKTIGYGYDQAHGSLTAPLTSGPDVILCTDWVQPNGNNGYNGFSLILAITKANLLANYIGVNVNGRTFTFDTLESGEIATTKYPGGSGVRCSWWNGLAGFVNGQTYTIELIPR